MTTRTLIIATLSAVTAFAGGYALLGAMQPEVAAAPTGIPAAQSSAIITGGFLPGLAGPVVAQEVYLGDYGYDDEDDDTKGDDYDDDDYEDDRQDSSDRKSKHDDDHHDDGDDHDDDDHDDDDDDDQRADAELEAWLANLDLDSLLTRFGEPQ